MKELEIYGTLGPSCKDETIIKTMFELGMTGIRLNLSHCNLWDRKEWIDHYNRVKDEMNSHADLLIDMHGPELRVHHLKNDILLEEETVITIDDNIFPKRVLEEIDINDMILLDDGKIKIKVIQVLNNSFNARVLRGGILKNNKSIAVVGKQIEGEVLTELDMLNLREANSYGVTAIMQPFVHDKEALIKVRSVLNELGLKHLKVYAKIEDSIGYEHLEELLDYCDCIVIARGDLGNAYGLTVLPVIQHRIEEVCKKHHKPYMVVTEMLNSMHNCAVPTRAEVNDVFQAVYNGASSIMLTGETASGKYPVEAMKYFTQTAYLALKEKEG